jgi:transposase InsO family protein
MCDTQYKKIRCDNAGENNTLEKLCEREELGIQFEYTSPGSPQYNGKVEQKFATLYARIRTMMNAALLPRHMRDRLWAEAATIATQI